MGWFLTSKVQGTSSGRRPMPGPAPLKQWDPNRTLAGIEALGAVMLVAALVLTWRLSGDFLAGYEHQRQSPKVGPKQVDLVHAPRWMSTQLRHEIAVLVAQNVTADPLDSASLEAAVRALTDDPWVERIDRLQRMPDGCFSLAARYRQPVAGVITAQGLRLVDIKGVLLPGLYPQEKAGQLPIPQILGVTQGPQRDGQVWPGQDVQAGLSLIRLLCNEPYISQVQAFDVSQRDAHGRIRLVLKTRNGSVNWGFPPGMENTIESDAVIKKARLAEVYRRTGSIDAGGAVVDVYSVDAFRMPARIHLPPPADPSVAVGYTWSR